MNLHIKRVHTSEKTFSCDKCDRRFTCQDYLDQHYRKHTDERPFQCSICKKTFHRVSSMEMHKLVHSNLRLFSCPFCGLHFKTRSYLKQHTVSHTGGRRFTCKHCSQQFKRFILYKQHLMDVHSEGTWHECQTCDKKFLIRHHLSEHMLKHSATKPYMCDKCPKQFSTSSEFKFHQFTMHDGAGRYGCGFCCRMFYYKFHVLKHLPYCSSLK